MSSSLFLITIIGILSACLGVWITSTHALSRRIIPFSGGVLAGVSLFWVLPEMASTLGWRAAAAWTFGGFALLWMIDRFVYPVCPACSATHEHDSCATRLHGFAGPLLIAATLHNTLDGWSIATAHASLGFGAALIVGITFHKLPEGVALGSIARASLGTKLAAIAWCAAVESTTLFGGLLGASVNSSFDARTLHILLAVAGGSFLYLGGHAIHGELRRSGPYPAFVPALTGFAGSSVLRLFVS